MLIKKIKYYANSPLDVHYIMWALKQNQLRTINLGINKFAKNLGHFSLDMLTLYALKSQQRRTFEMNLVIVKLFQVSFNILKTLKLFHQRIKWQKKICQPLISRVLSLMDKNKFSLKQPEWELLIQQSPKNNRMYLSHASNVDITFLHTFHLIFEHFILFYH